MVGPLTARDVGRVVALGSIALLSLLAFGGGVAQAAPPVDRVSFGVDGLFPDYAPQIRDYVVRCEDAPVTVNAQASGTWKVSIAGGAFRTGKLHKDVSIIAGQSFTVTAQQAGRPESFNYYVRCLPNDFPRFTYDRYGPVTPKLISVENVESPLIHRYAMIFDSHGVPVWWYHAPTHDVKVLPDGNLVWFAYSADPVSWEVRRPDGTLAAGAPHRGPSPQRSRHPVPPERELSGRVIRQPGPRRHERLRRLERRNRPAGRAPGDEPQRPAPMGLESEGPHRAFGDRPLVAVCDRSRYDVNHWNSIEPDGNSVIASMRNTDAVYKINKTTGNIVWKLGGHAYLEEPHGEERPALLHARWPARRPPSARRNAGDVRRPHLLPNGDKQPRGVRYRINQTNGTATLVQSITDPAIKESSCCGSARRLNSGDWLISWGGLGNLIGGYKPNGDRTFILHLKANRTYRAEPVPANAVTLPELRQGMDTMCAGGCRLSAGWPQPTLFSACSRRMW